VEKRGGQSIPTHFTLIEVQDLEKRMRDKSAEEILRWAIETLGERVALASSFGAEDVALIDMMSKIDTEKTKVFTLDTGRLNQETYDVMDEIKKKYGILVDIYCPDHHELESMLRTHRMNLMYDSVENRKLCCEIRKVHPLDRALRDMSGWITGLRREQTSTRSAISKIEIDTIHNDIIKINPLADWDNEMVWSYIRHNDVPYNKLHDKGYPSIGCEPCTRAVEPNEDPRSGRWWWESSAHKECGLHWDPTRNK
jgi:phosphoadenosine phosphosulfate reductase